MSDAPTIIALIFATSAASLTLSKSDMMAPWRAWMYARHASLGELADCHYCLSHWIALVLVLLYRPKVVSGVWLMDPVIEWLALVGAAALVSALISYLMRGAPTHTVPPGTTGVASKHLSPPDAS